MTNSIRDSRATRIGHAARRVRNTATGHVDEANIAEMLDWDDCVSLNQIRSGIAYYGSLPPLLLVALTELATLTEQTEGEVAA